jgi:hypothetical protein
MTQLSHLEGWSMSLHRIQRREKLVSHMGQRVKRTFSLSQWAWPRRFIRAIMEKVRFTSSGEYGLLRVSFIWSVSGFQRYRPKEGWLLCTSPNVLVLEAASHPPPSVT